MAVSDDTNQTHLYRNPTNGSLVEETKVVGRFFHAFSDNSKYLATCLRGEVRIYINSEFEDCSSMPYCMECQNSTCLQCNQLEDYFLNSSSGRCEFCELNDCLLCSSLDACVECDEANGNFLNSNTGVCEKCKIEHCLDCSNLTACTSCD